MWALNLNNCKDPADYAYCICVRYSCGYSRPNRTHLSKRWLEDGTAECDCSSMVSWCLFMAEWIPENPWFHTAIEREYLQENGFEMFEFGSRELMRNDVLWRSGHTGVYIGDGLQAEALRTERHDAGHDGSAPGDQDGGETVARVLTHDWEYVLRRIEKPIKELINMTFLFTTAGKHSGHVYLYDGGQVKMIRTVGEQEAIKRAHLLATGAAIPFIHLEDGDQLIAVAGSEPVR